MSSIITPTAARSDAARKGVIGLAADSILLAITSWGRAYFKGSRALCDVPPNPLGPADNFVEDLLQRLSVGLT